VSAIGRKRRRRGEAVGSVGRGDRGDRLAEAGAPVLVKRYDGTIHGFYWMLGALETAQVLHDDIAEAATPALTPVAAA